ncbi:MAG: LD-carboxypeptidase [Gammaproteobacteria bacterium]|nr:LD-carboxypeptidase [Gammaproteobacteria bacterium]
MTTRRQMLTAATLAALAPLVGESAAKKDRAGGAKAAATTVPPGALPSRPAVKPPAIRAGDTIGLMIPSSANWDPFDVDVVLEALAALGLKGKLGAHVFDRRGYLAGRDEDRAADFNALMRDPEVRAIHCLRGGWGAARLLQLVDFDAVARGPKAVIGYSDITALLLALHARTGLITFHGPNGSSEWNETNVGWLQRVTWRGEAVTFENPRQPTGAIVADEFRTRPITGGRARGRLLGGNLTVLTALIGSPYLPDFSDAILFIEDVQEAPYRIDRMLVQLKLAGVLERLRGVVWGTCSKCDPGEGFGSLTIPDVLDDHIKPLGVPAYHGAMIGHMGRQFTLPVGAEVELDAERGTLRMLEPAVV